MTEVLKRVSDYLAQRKGLPVLFGVGLMMISLILNLLPAWPVVGWLAKTDLLLHLGAILGVLGILLGDAL
ncbi:MAG: hypothetical protein E4H27_02840 [Anaerolineales bacterium]|nr:MAG: hypothetical protein E4H27_02840 [Anaerolineales bacterium]